MTKVSSLTLAGPFLSLMVMGHLAGAACEPARFASPTVVDSQAGGLILVTHPSDAFDFSQAAKGGIDKLIRFGKGKRLTTEIGRASCRERV